MSVIVNSDAFVDAVKSNHSAWSFTEIGLVPDNIRFALELHDCTIQLIISVETTVKNLRRHPEFSNVEAMMKICEAAMLSTRSEIIGSGLNVIQVFFHFEDLLWEIVIKRSKNDEAICTSLHSADAKRLFKGRRKGRRIGVFAFEGL
jgi:hypothetical protein